MSLADAIIEENVNSVRQLLRYGVDVNQLDEYGFTPLVEAAIVDNIEITQLLLEQGARPNAADVTGNTALHWAVENSNMGLVQLLLKHRANPNAYNLAGQSVLVIPTLRQQSELKSLLIQAGADQSFAQDYINTKLLGHLFELIGTAGIVDPDNQYVEVDFEGFLLEITLGLIADSLAQFQNHFAARQLRRYAGVSKYIVDLLLRASQLIKLQQYRVDLKKAAPKIHDLLNHDPLIIPVGYEGHAITFIRFGDIWVKCDRREDSRLYDHVMFYRVRNVRNLNEHFLWNLIYQKQTDQFINEEIDSLLGLEPITELKVEAQVSGNCSWANVEATIPALFFLTMMKTNSESKSLGYYKTLALNFFHRWRDWNKERSLGFCIQGYKEGDVLQKACKAEILAAILFQCSEPGREATHDQIDKIVTLLIQSPYHYILMNYLRTYYYDSPSEEGKRFADLLKGYGFPK